MVGLYILIALAEYFQVSVDQLLGLIPLNNEIYIAEQTGTENFWNKKLQYLLRTRKGYWNDDYVEFLINNVWKIENPVSVLDCGCGYGYLGLLFMQKLRLEHVDVRMNDKIEFITLEHPQYHQIKQDFLDYNDWNAGLSATEREKVVEHLISHGMDRKEAEDYCNRNVVIAEYFSKHPETGYTFAKGQMISYGKKKMLAD